MGTPSNLFCGNIPVETDSALGHNFTDIGFTVDGVTVEGGTDAPDQMVDGTNVAVRRFLNNLAPKISFGLAEPTITNLSLVIPGASINGGDLEVGLPGGDTLSLMSVRLTKANPMPGVTSVTILAPRVAPMGNPNVPLKKAEASVVPVELGCLLPDILENDLVVNGTFATDTDWTKGAGWAIPGGAGANATAAASDLEEAVPIGYIEGVDYIVKFTISGYSSGTLTPVLNGTSGTARSADGTFEETIKAGSGSSGLQLTAAGPATLTVDDVIVYPANALNIVIITP